MPPRAATPRRSLTRRALCLVAACAALAAASPLAAQDLEARLGDTDGASVEVTVSNPLDFAVEVIGVRIAIKEEGGEPVNYLSTDRVREALAPGGSWTGRLTFATEEGGAPDADVDWGNYDRLSVGAALDIDAFAPAAEAAAAGRDWDAIVEQRGVVRARLPVVSRTARFHGPQVTASGLDARRYFDLERMDALRDGLDNALCAIASDEIRGLSGGAAAQLEQYNVLSERMRGVGLHINCIDSAARLTAARMLLRSARPQDALLFKETDESGALLPEWRPIFIEANLALARTAAELDVQLFTAIEPALRALAEVRTLDPENRDMQPIADKLIPNAAQWVIRKSGAMDRDLSSAEDCLELIRPMWSNYPVVEQAAAAYATALIEAGLEYCNRREYVNAHNRFIRGERMLVGIVEWESRANEINHCRALGALQEGRELAQHPTDDSGPERGFAKLAEAQQRFTLTDEEIASFKADIASGWVLVAQRNLAATPPTLGAATEALARAEEISPTGRTDAMREQWVVMAERMYDYDGLTMTGARVARAREALGMAEGFDPDRVAAINGKLNLAFYGYRVGIPAGALLLGLLGLVLSWSKKRQAARLVQSVDDL